MYFDVEDNYNYPNEEYFKDAFCKILEHIYKNSNINPYALHLQVNVDTCNCVKVTLLDDTTSTFENICFEIDNNNEMLEKYFTEEKLDEVRF